MTTQTRSYRKAISVGLALCLAFGPSAVYATYQTITMSSPSQSSSWGSGPGTNLTVSGHVTWELDSANWVFDPRPDTVNVYIHAGSNAGTVTNSTYVSTTNVQAPGDPGTGDESYSTTLALTPANPPIAGGNGAYANYYIEAKPQFGGTDCIDDTGQVIKKITQINVQNG